MSIKIQIHNIQHNIPKQNKKKRKRSVRKVSQIKKLLPALTNDRPISSYPSQHSEILQKKEKEILGSSQIKKKSIQKKKNLPIHTFPEYRNLKTQRPVVYPRKKK